MTQIESQKQNETKRINVILGKLIKSKPMEEVDELKSTTCVV